MRRGDVYDASLDPTLGSEQAGARPVIIVSRNSINRNSPVLIVVPCTTSLSRELYPSRIVIEPLEGGFTSRSVALGDQVRTIDKRRLGRFRGTLSLETMERLASALCVAMDLPG